MLAAANQPLHPQFGPTQGISCGYNLPSTKQLIGSGWPDPSGLQPDPEFSLDSSTLWTMVLVIVSAEGEKIGYRIVGTTAVRRASLQSDAAHCAK